MAVIMVPVQQAESTAVTSNGDKPFPAGPWAGTIEEVRVRPLTYLSDLDAETLAKRGYATADVEVFSMQLGDNSPLDQQDSVGARKMFTQDIVVRDGDLTLEDVNTLGQDSPAWQLRDRSAAFIANLAHVLGQTEIVEIDGQQVAAVAEGFVEALLNGQFNGTKIGYEVAHRTYKKRDGSQATEMFVSRFFVVD